MKDLRNCPFCGMDSPDYCDEHGGDWHFIQCRSMECQAEGSRARSRDKAITAWNRRTPPPINAGAVKEAMYQPGMDGNTGTSMRRISVLSDEVRRLTAELEKEKMGWQCGGPDQRAQEKKCGHGPEMLKVVDLYCAQCVEEAK